MAKMSLQIQMHKKLVELEKQVQDLESLKVDILELLKEIKNEDSYPPQSRFRKDYLKRLDKALANVKKGKVRHFTNFEQFAKAVS